MVKYRIFAGLGGGVNSVCYQYTKEFDNEQDASDEAYELAVEDYESYAGNHGIMGWIEALEEAEQGFLHEEKDIPTYQEDLEEVAQDIYNDSVESWISYYVEEVKEGEWEGDPDLDPNN